jgi:hypothetical protein
LQRLRRCVLAVLDLASLETTWGNLWLPVLRRIRSE